ncbi:hypothetical protein EYZ11_003528 [Aspergillus tanneri]|nr:hypothetical protein EYZ11_003528 [Aspergillus tanneri]
MICGLGVLKSYKLTYEPTTAQHAIFDRTKTINQWNIEARFLKEITDHFSPSAELLDIYSESGKVIFTSFTTKITEGKEILKQPVHTSVAFDKKDFEHFLAEDSLHIVISLKDFKAVIAHADTSGVMITARYTRPCRPLQLAYDFRGVRAEFTLMTRGDPDVGDVPNSSGVAELSARQTPAPVQSNTSNGTAAGSTQMPPPPPPRTRSIRPLTGSSARNTQQAQTESQQPPASINLDSLFVPADDDRQWDVPDESEETEDILGWDAMADQDNASLGLRLRETEPSMNYQDDQPAMDQEEEMGIPPTQRISQLHGLGLFD